MAKHLSDTETPQGIFAVMPRELASLPALTGQFLLLDGIQDPGNVGTLVRTADAAGVGTVVFGAGTADPFNPKVLRAMQGSQFHVRIVMADLAPLIAQLQAAGIACTARSSTSTRKTTGSWRLRNNSPWWSAMKATACRKLAHRNNQKSLHSHQRSR